MFFCREPLRNAGALMLGLVRGSDVVVGLELSRRAVGCGVLRRHGVMPRPLRADCDYRRWRGTDETFRPLSSLRHKTVSKTVIEGH